MKIEIDQRRPGLVNKAETNENRILEKVHKQGLNVLTLQFISQILKSTLGCF